MEGQTNVQIRLPFFVLKLMQTPLDTRPKTSSTVDK